MCFGLREEEEYRQVEESDGEFCDAVSYVANFI